MAGALLKFAALAVFFLAFTIESCHSVCCSSKQLRCNDCTKATPCCGHGKCNVFCCNCDDGCRAGNCRRRRSLVEEMLLGIVPEGPSTAHHIVAFADEDGDGRLSYEEAHKYLDAKHGVGPHNRGKRDLQALDADNDMFLSPDEIDPGMIQVN